MKSRNLTWLALAVTALAVLAGLSLVIGVSDTSSDILAISRVPRTAAAILAGAALGIAGMLMQLLAQNRFVEPSTVGTTESATLGLLAVSVLAPSAAIGWKMTAAAVAAMGGTALFLLAIRSIKHRGGFTVPLVGIMLGGVIGAVTTFYAYQFDLLQSLNAWTLGSFSGTIRGRYELLWLVAIALVVAYIAADRFTLVGLGESYAVNAGLNYRRMEALGLSIVAAVAAIVVTVVGSIPFLGLVVPNLVSLWMGDNARKSLPWVALIGAIFTLACDIIGRIIRYPFEMPVGTVVGVIGGAIFLTMLLRRNRAQA